MRFDVNVFLTYAGREAMQPTVYLTAAVIGSIICFLTQNWSAVPFLVPLLVQVMARANVRFRQRHRDALVELPAQKEDPVFIMDTQGRILLSVGKTRDLFDHYGVTHLKEFISEEAFDRIITSTASNPADPEGVEVFSSKTLKWYEVKATQTAMAYGDKRPKVLVWFQDVSLRQIYYLRLKDLLRYSDTLITLLDREQAKPGAEFQHLAIFLLKEYEGVYIARDREAGGLTGYAFKVSGHGIQKSEAIPLASDAKDPLSAARQGGRLLVDDVQAHESPGAFGAAHDFNPAVQGFFGRPVRNFIAWAEADVSAIAFNFRSDITLHEREFFKVVVKIFKTMTVMTDLKKKLEARKD